MLSDLPKITNPVKDKDKFQSLVYLTLNPGFIPPIVELQETGILAMALSLTPCSLLGQNTHCLLSSVFVNNEWFGLEDL